MCQEAGSREFKGETLQPGWSLDLTMNDPVTGAPWDLSRRDVQDRVRKLIRTTKPYVIIGSPPCTAFSPLQALNKGRRDKRIVDKELRAAKAHILFCLEVYQTQLDGMRHFVHEHPLRSSAWKMTEMKIFMMKPEVGVVEMQMCAFGMVATD